MTVNTAQYLLAATMYPLACYQSTLGLLNRQKAEIERLQKRLDIVENYIYIYIYIYDIEYASDKAGSNDRIDEAIENYNNLVKEMTEAE